MSPTPKSTARSADRKYFPVTPVGAPSSRPRPNVLLASNRLPEMWPLGRGRAWAAVANSAMPRVASKMVRPVMGRERSAPIARNVGFVHNNDVVRLHTIAWIVTAAAACGSRPSTPPAASPELRPTVRAVLLPTAPVAQVLLALLAPSAGDAALPSSSIGPAPPHLVCGSSVRRSRSRPHPGGRVVLKVACRAAFATARFVEGDVPRRLDRDRRGVPRRPALRRPVAAPRAQRRDRRDRQLRGRAVQNLGGGGWSAWPASRSARTDTRDGTGTEKYWLDDGTLYSERALVAGVPSGPERIYAPDGTMLATAQRVHEKLDGARAPVPARHAADRGDPRGRCAARQPADLAGLAAPARTSPTIAAASATASTRSGAPRR